LGAFDAQLASPVFRMTSPMTVRSSSFRRRSAFSHHFESEPPKPVHALRRGKGSASLLSLIHAPEGVYQSDRNSARRFVSSGKRPRRAFSPWALDAQIGRLVLGRPPRKRCGFLPDRYLPMAFLTSNRVGLVAFGLTTSCYRLGGIPTRIFVRLASDSSTAVSAIGNSFSAFLRESVLRFDQHASPS
jgi:hypothetical protein